MIFCAWPMRLFRSRDDVSGLSGAVENGLATEGINRLSNGLPILTKFFTAQDPRPLALPPEAIRNAGCVRKGMYLENGVRHAALR